MPTFSRFILNLDIFGASVPGFNLNGQKTIKTKTGVLISIMITIITVLFALLKLQFMLMRKRP